jgi:hypothetical protein
MNKAIFTIRTEVPGGVVETVGHRVSRRYVTRCIMANGHAAPPNLSDTRRAATQAHEYCVSTIRERAALNARTGVVA